MKGLILQNEHLCQKQYQTKRRKDTSLQESLLLKAMMLRKTDDAETFVLQLDS